MREPLKIIKTPQRVNCQVAEWHTGTGSSQERQPIDARIVSAHNDGNPLFRPPKLSRRNCER